MLSDDSPSNKLLITGVSGLLGNALAIYFRNRCEVVGLYHRHPVAIEGIRTKFSDVLDSTSIRGAVEEFEPDVVVHCASLTNLEHCEAEKKLTRKINVNGTHMVTEAVRHSQIKLVYISTDAIFDGEKGNYGETDAVHPLNAYGSSKLEGENEAERHSNTLIFRTNIFGWNVQEKESLAEWIINNLSRQKPIQGFTDAIFSSIYTLELASILERALARDLKGVYHACSSSSLSKYEFACKLAERFRLNPSLIDPISIDDFHFRARRGKDLSMNVSKLTRDLAWEPPKITDSIDAFYRDFMTGLPQTKEKGRISVQCYPQLDIIPYGRQSIDDEDIQSVVKVLKSSNLTQGPKIPEFEAALCQYTGARYAVAVNSGTSALHLACRAAQLREGQDAITSANTFVASANCVVFCGGRPIFADIEPRTYNLTAETVEEKITLNTRVILPVHFAGQSCDMAAIRQVVNHAERKRGEKIFIIEDASHALGSLYLSKRVGCCEFSDMAVFSFHPVKHITTGEGGAVLTNDKELHQSLLRLRSHGIVRDPNWDLPWYYEQIELGYNYRITDIQCALGISQLKKLPLHVQRRREIVETYHRRFTDLKNLQIPFEMPDCRSNFHLYVLRIDFPAIRMDRAQFMLALRERRIQTQVHYIPVHTQPFYRKHYETKVGDCPNVEAYYQQCLSIPLYPAMTDMDVDRVVDTISGFVDTKG